MNTTTSIIFTILLMVSRALEFTYEAGKASAPYIKMAVAFVIAVALYSYENRHKVNEFRHRLSRAFIYESPSRLKAPKRIRFRRPANTMMVA